MPIVIDPGFSWPPEVDPVVSPDGRLTAIVDPAHAGVLLRADFDDSVPDTPAQPEKVLRRNLTPNPRFRNSMQGWSPVQCQATIVPRGSLFPGAGDWMGDDIVKIEANAGREGSFYIQHSGFPIDAEKKIAVGAPLQGSGRFWIYFTDADGKRVNPQTQSPLMTFEAGGWATHVGDVPEGATRAQPYLGSLTDYARVAYFGPLTVAQASTESAALAKVATYFDGSTPTSGTKRYRWTGTPNASISEEYTPATPFIPGKPGTVAKVRFERQDGSVVRSGNPAWAPGGYAHAYDHEATLGGGTLWRAVPIRFDGTEGTPSEYVGAVIPALSDGWAWLKPVANPNKAMLLKVEPPDLSYDGRVDTTSIAGAPRPAATWDVLEGFTTQLRSLVREKDVEEQLMALLDEGPVLAQFPACAGLPDFYFIRGKLDLEHVHWDGWPWRRYQWDVIQIDRPNTTHSPLRIPGLSYDTVERDWTTYDQLKSTVESYNKLLEP